MGWRGAGASAGEAAVKESALKTRLCADINKIQGAYAVRHEDRYAVGRLDMIIKLPLHPIFFAEAKLIVGGFLFAPSSRQFIEGKRIKAAGLEAILVAWKRLDLYVSEWTEQADIRDCFTAAPPYHVVIMEFFRQRKNA